MNILIFEGVATSGKTTIEAAIAEQLRLQGKRVAVISEEVTLLPILHNANQRAAQRHLMRVVRESLKIATDILIFDRLHITHAFRTNRSVGEYGEIEQLLRLHTARIILLTLSHTELRRRLKIALRDRDDKWVAYARQKGDFQAIASYYRSQQQRLVEIVGQSSLLVQQTDASVLSAGALASQIIVSMGETG